MLTYLQLFSSTDQRSIYRWSNEIRQNPVNPAKLKLFLYPPSPGECRLIAAVLLVEAALLALALGCWFDRIL